MDKENEPIARLLDEKQNEMSSFRLTLWSLRPHREAERTLDEIIAHKRKFPDSTSYDRR